VLKPECSDCLVLASLMAANDTIVALQHLVRELRHEVENHKAAAAGWPRHPDTGEEMRL